MTALVMVVVGLMVVAAVLGWVLPSGSRWSNAVAVGLVAGMATLGLVAILDGPVTTSGGVVSGSLLVDLFIVAVVGGGPLAAAVLRLVDHEPDGLERGAHAAAVLRGGTWIGAFERAAVFGALAAGWPEGLAVVLALKGLGRYSELRADASGQAAPGTSGGVAERFIIGTFASVLWGVASAGAFAALVR